MSERCVVHRLGLAAYEPTWRLQAELAAEIAAGERPPTLLLLEHPHTYTFGRRGQMKNLLWDERELQRRGVAVHWVDRGGDVTYHGPDQLVGYPLLPLGRVGLRVDPEKDSSRLPQADYVGYVRRLEEALILALASLGVASWQIAGLTGVWVDDPAPGSQPGEGTGPAKIAAIGLKVDARGVSRHGFALNVKPDMTYWHGIVGCGLVDHRVRRLSDLLPASPAMEAVQDAVVAAFGGVFGYQMQEEELVLDAGFMNRLGFGFV
ncbi:MAG TPA: lipoyl(octanoyl) transferase LipB [Anaerolineales bacterium]|nr:lipoyl(octanoyl) transferase LipB [Anaerolineales bacterium]